MCIYTPSMLQSQLSLKLPGLQVGGEKKKKKEIKSIYWM